MPQASGLPGAHEVRERAACGGQRIHRRVGRVLGEWRQVNPDLAEKQGYRVLEVLEGEYPRGLAGRDDPPSTPSNFVRFARFVVLAVFPRFPAAGLLALGGSRLRAVRVSDDWGGREI